MSMIWKALVKLDKIANVILAPIFNVIFSGEHKFGHKDETISSVLGLNIINNNCVLCKITCFILGFFEKDHCTKSIRKDHK